MHGQNNFHEYFSHQLGFYLQILCGTIILTLRLLVSSAVTTFANSLDPDQVRQYVGPDLDPNCLTHIFLKYFFEKFSFEKNQQTTKKHEKLPSMQRVILCRAMRKPVYSIYEQQKLGLACACAKCDQHIAI